MSFSAIQPRRLAAILTALLITATGVVMLGGPAVADQSPIDQRYESDAALAPLLGPPVGKEFAVADGPQRNYEHGSLYYSYRTGVHETHGAIHERYESLGGPSRFGLPTTDQVQLNSHNDWYVLGALSNFERATIVWDLRSNTTFWMNKDIADYWRPRSYPILIMPTSDEVPVTGGKKVSFLLDNAADVYWSEDTGAHLVLTDAFEGRIANAEIGKKWVSLGGVDGELGFPVSDVAAGEKEQCVWQTFKRGAIFRKGRITESGTAYEIHGSIYETWKSAGGLEYLGYPTSDQRLVAEGLEVSFQHGSILLRGDTGRTVVDYKP